MEDKKRSKWKKTISLFVVFAIAVQMTMNYSNVIIANEDESVAIQDLKEDTTDKVSVSIEGIAGTTSGEIAIGKIMPLTFDGYDFINATVDNAVVNYIGIYEGKYYYANTEDDKAGAYLLGDLKVKLNYKKTIHDYTITYNYDENVLKVIGDDIVNETKSAKFRIEMISYDHEVVSVKDGDAFLTADADGYYYVVNDGTNKNVTIASNEIKEYNVTYRTDYAKNVTYNMPATVKAGENWKGTIFSRGKNANLSVGTLNSILLNGEYLMIPNGGVNGEVKESTLSDGTKVTVKVERVYNALIRYDYTYTIEVMDVKTNLKFTPVLYDADVNDITMTNIEGLNVYHWDGNKLNRLSVGDVINKNNSIDYFLVITEAGYEAKLDTISGEGSKIIEKIDLLKDAKVKAEADKLGCNYFFYYSDKEVKKRTVNIASQRIQYNVTYNVVNITDDHVYNITDQNIIQVSSTEPTKAGYTFIGWKLEDTGTIYQVNDEIVLNEKLVKALKTNTIKFVAQWVKNEDAKTASYNIKYFFQDDKGGFVENIELRKTIKNAPIGATAFLMNKETIGEYEFDANNKNNVLSTVILANNETTPLRAYYVKAKRTMTYNKGNAKEGNAPIDKLNPYNKGTEAIVMNNDGNLIGDFKSKEDQAFVCWKTANSNYYFPGDKIVMDTNITLSPVFVGDFKGDNVLSFTFGDNGTIEGRNKFAVPPHHLFGEVIKEAYQLPTAKANQGYKFDGWYLGNEKIASDNTALFNQIKAWEQGGTLEARFIVDEEQRHDVHYTVNYFLDNENTNDSIIVSDTNVPQATTTLKVRDLNISDDKYEGYKFLTVTPEGIKNGDVISNGSEINVYYVKDADQWTTVEFSAGAHGTLNGTNAVFYSDVLIGKTFEDQNIEIPTITANKGWIVSEDKWNINVSSETKIEKDFKIIAQYKEDRNDDGIADEDQYVSVTFHAGEHGNYDGKDTTKLEKLIPNDKVTAPKLSVEEGFIFVGYDKEVIAEIANDTVNLEYTALYKEDRNGDGIADEDQYITVIFNAGNRGNYAGEITKTLYNMLPGDEVQQPVLSVDAGYTFTGYDKKVFEAIPSKTEKLIEYTAQYTQNPILPDGTAPVDPTPDVPTTVAPNPTAPTPIVNNAGVPVAQAPVIPAPVAPVVPDDTVVVENNATPKANGNTKIKKEKTPLAKSNKEWAFMNLMFAVMTVLLGAWNILSKCKNNEFSEQISANRKRIIKVNSGLLAIISIFAFVSTQNMTATMVIFDKWSMLMFALVFVQVGLVVYARKFKKVQNDSSREAI